MLWYKGWLETRFRVLFMFLYAIFPIPLITLTAHAVAPRFDPSLVEMKGMVGYFALFYSIVPLMLAGAGIKTQADFRPQKGLHGSIYFTLSLPVSRLRLLVTRAGLGMAEAAVVLTIAPFAIWIMLPPLRVHTTALELFEYWLALSVCASAFYFLGVLLSTFLDDLWQNWVSLFGIVFLYGLSSRFPGTPVNILWAMGAASPLFTHTFPWASMSFALGVAAILLSAALKVVETREY